MPETLEIAIRQAKNVEVLVRDIPYVIISNVGQPAGQNQS